MTDDYYEQLRLFLLIAMLSKDSIAMRVCTENKSIDTMVDLISNREGTEKFI